MLSLSLLAGCREDVVTAPPLEYPFTLYGILNPTSHVQGVVVAPMQDRLRPISAAPLDAVVTSADLTSGNVRVWADSVVSDGTAGFSHVYWSDFRVEYGRTYRIEAMRSDGTGSSAVVRVPPQVDVEVSDLGVTTREIRLPGSGFRVISAIVIYSYLSDPRMFTFSIDYSMRLREEADGWSLTVWFEEYAAWLVSWCRSLSSNQEGALVGESTTESGAPLVAASSSPAVGVRNAGSGSCTLMRVSVDVTIADEAWHPPTEVQREPPRIPEPIRDLNRHENPLFDREAMAHPGAFSNVENGFGFVGAGYRQRIDLRL